MEKNLKIIILTFIIAAIVTQLPFPEAFTPSARIMIAITLIAAVFWVTECIPIPVTALLVILLQGLFQIQSFPKVFSYIAHPVNALLIAGFIIAASLKKYKLDKRIGLQFVSMMGEKTTHTIFGVMAATAFLSMWISNTAAAAIMLPIGVGILGKWKESPKGTNMGKAMIIGIAFAANIGGIATPLGTPPVPITIAFLDSLAGIKLSFLDWVVRAVPLVIILVPLAWKVITSIYKPEIERVTGGMEKIKQELSEMGKLTKKQMHALILFAVAIILWFLDPLRIILPIPTNWMYIASLLIAIMYLLPSIGVVTWKEAKKEIGWGILILVGGGLALGSGLEATGVVSIIAGYMQTLLIHSELIVVIAAVALITAFSITFFSSLTATSSTFVPIAIALAFALKIDPVLLAMVAGAAACFAFLLPANTPPNAIAYKNGFFKTHEMTKVGLLLTVLCVGILIATAISYWAILF